MCRCAYFGSSNQVIAALSVSGEADLILNEKLQECITDVCYAAKAIAIGMGYRGDEYSPL